MSMFEQIDLSTIIGFVTLLLTIIITYTRSQWKINRAIIEEKSDINYIKMRLEELNLEIKKLESGKVDKEFYTKIQNTNEECIRELKQVIQSNHTEIINLIKRDIK